MFTHGFIDSIKDFKYNKQAILIELFKKSLFKKSVKEINKYLIDSIKKTKSSKKYSDDITLLSIKRKE